MDEQTTKNAERLTVASYRHSREYGGPEEGGWHFNYHRLVRDSIQTFGSAEERNEWLETQEEVKGIVHKTFSSEDSVPEEFFNYPAQTKRPVYS